MGSRDIFIHHYFRVLGRKLDNFIPTALRNETNELRRCRIMIGSAFSVGVLTLILSFTRLMTEGWDSLLGWIFIAVSLLMLSTPLVLRLTKSILLAGSLIPAVGVSTLIFMSIFEGGIESEAMYWFPFAPLVAAFFVNAFASILFGLIILIALVVIYFVQLSGMISPSQLPTDVLLLLKLISATGAVIFGASVAWLYETNRHKSESELQKSNMRTEAIISAIPDCMFLLNSEGKILEIKEVDSPGILNLKLHITDHKFNTIMELVSNEDKARIATQLQIAISVGSIQVEEYELHTAEQVSSLEVRMVPMNKEEVLAIIRDVTSERNIERLKNEFISTVSHELRTPLTAIVGYLSLLQGGVVSGIPKEANDMIENANTNAARLSSLIDDILDLQKVSGGHLQYSMNDVLLSEFIKQTIEFNQGYATKYHVQLVCENLAEKNNIRIDTNRMHQVMANLISNAIKYSPQGEKVSVQAQCNNGQINISVTDKGAGIPKEFRSQVFEKFTQSDSSNTRQVGGTGLGLSISKMIVEAHGGSIDFETEIGIGTTFNIYLPTIVNNN